MRDDDLAAFIACFDENGTPRPADEAVFFAFGDLQATKSTSTLGPPKSASEGAERDRTWPALVPQRSGVVEYVSNTLLRVKMDPDDERPAKAQGFPLRNRVPYVVKGDKFIAGASIIAGAPPRRIAIKSYLQNKYQPLDEVSANDPVDRYAAVKALPYLPEKKKQAVIALEKQLDTEQEDRVLLETAGAGTALKSSKAWEQLEAFVWKQERADLRMEAVFILTELRSPGARDVLVKIANDKNFADDEIRQAAVWGLGKAGLKQYSELLPFLKDSDRDVVLHAIAAFDNDTPEPVITQLIAALISGNEQHAPAASEALRIIGSDLVIAHLVAAAREKKGTVDWVLATLGRLPAGKVRSALKDDALLDQLKPLLLLTDNWMADDSIDIDLKFVLKQNL